MTKDEQLTPTAQELIPRLREKQKIQRRAPVLTATMVAAIVMIVGALVYGFASYTAADDVLKQQQQQNFKSIGDLQEQMKGVCRKVDDFGKLTTEEREGCYRAENSIPPVPPSTPAPVTTYEGLSPSQVQAMINQSLATLPRPLSIEDVIRAATDIYKANPPKDGKDVTPEQVAATVIAVCGVEKCRGVPGVDGKDAPPVSDAQILAQVNTFCSGPGEPCRSTVAGPPGQSPACLSEPSQCVGPEGKQGVGIASIERHCEDPTEPYLRFVFDRPRADGETGYNVPMPVTFCVP
jgi:hypothetical protein